MYIRFVPSKHLQVQAMDTLFFSPAYMEEVFAGLNLVLAGWLLLFLAPFFPQFKYTFLLVDGIVILYCGVYLFLLVPIVIAIIERGESVNFGSLGTSALSKQRCDASRMDTLCGIRLVCGK